MVLVDAGIRPGGGPTRTTEKNRHDASRPPFKAGADYLVVDPGGCGRRTRRRNGGAGRQGSVDEGRERRISRGERRLGCPKGYWIGARRFCRDGGRRDKPYARPRTRDFGHKSADASGVVCRQIRVAPRARAANPQNVVIAFSGRASCARPALPARRSIRPKIKVRRTHSKIDYRHHRRLRRPAAVRRDDARCFALAFFPPGVFGFLREKSSLRRCRAAEA